MKQEEAILSDIEGKAYESSIMTELILVTPNQDERSVEDICNSGDAQLRDIISYGN